MIENNYHRRNNLTAIHSAKGNLKKRKSQSDNVVF